MNMHRINRQLILWCVTFLFSGIAIAQPGSTATQIDEAISFAEEGAYESALRMIEPLLENEARNDARAWYVAGYAHKGRYKDYIFRSASTSKLVSAERSIAVEQLLEAYELDKKATFPGKISELVEDALDYLSKTYMNDAVKGVHGFQMGMDEEVLGYFMQFVKIRNVLDPTENWIREEVELEKNLARANRVLLESIASSKTSSIQKKEELFEKVVSHYLRAIELDGVDYTARYNLAINLYNRGVSELKSIDHTTSMFELMEIQDICVLMFKEALNPMLAAHNMDNDKKETLKGLMTIYRALSQNVESDKYKLLLEEAVK
jgi:tetratricopeptide (TPR) repeat protein